MMTFEELMALPDEAWDKVADAIKEAIVDERDAARRCHREAEETCTNLGKKIEQLGEVVEAARQWQRDGRSNSAGDLLCDLLAKLDSGERDV